MNFYESLGLTHEEFAEKYENTGLVERRHHDTFPLDLLCYSRKCVHENVWDKATSLCRGIIITRGQEGHDGGEIIARPFEKFHNYGSTTPVGESQAIPIGQPVVWEKMDGFMCTMYRWENKDYIASKGSFHSIHAKWATAQIRKMWGDRLPFVTLGGSKTLVFEGLHRDLRIVIDYKERQELVLLAVIDNETGEEYSPENLETIARVLGFNTPLNFELTLEQARATSLGDGKCDEEGYVLTWYRDGVPPFRLKMKMLQYLKLHRLITQTSPKRVLEALENDWVKTLDEWTNDTMPWFNNFISKWRTFLERNYSELYVNSCAQFELARKKLNAPPYGGELPTRKQWAEEFNQTPDLSPILFALLDSKDIKRVIWKKIRPLVKSTQPLVDAHA